MSEASSNQIAVILPAAGQSRRFGEAGGSDAAGSKLDAELGGRAVLLRAVELFANRSEVAQIILAVAPDELDRVKLRWGDRLGLLGGKIVAGGERERWETVSKALEAVEPGVNRVAVHDAARPVPDERMVGRVLAAAASHPAVIPAVRIHATVKRVGSEPSEGGEGGSGSEASDPLDAILGAAGKAEQVPTYPIRETVSREGLWTAQTPQVFELELLRRAYRQIEEGAVDPGAVTDDAGLVEALGEAVVAVEGDPLNVKITVPDDLRFAEAVLAMRSGGAGTGSGGVGPKRRFPTWAESEEDD
jgi:2-C-methyl-D-erythritol 4-phosphate cytidylyltransferase